MKMAIELNEVSAGYKNAEILRKISLSIPAGSFCGIIGPNGSGKTTLLRTITGMIENCGGSVCLFGNKITSIDPGKRSKLVGLVPQSVETAMPFTVSEIVMIGRTSSIPRWGRPSKKDRLIVERSMVYTNVIDMKNKLFTELSGGERQRVVIAMALAQQPDILLLDEATSHLDINHRLEVMQIVERLHSEESKTIVMVSHDLNMAAEFCDHLFLLNCGSLVSEGTPEKVFQESTLRDVYRCDIRVLKNPASGSLTITPAPRLAPEHSGKGTTVYVIGGGGCAEEILRRLSICEYKLFAGVLNEQDSDSDVTAALDIPTVLEKPFSPITNESIRKAKALVDNSNIVVISSVPFGSGNVANLELAEYALENNKRVLIMDKVHERDYTSGKQAVKAVDRLCVNGAVLWSSITDLIDLLRHTNTQE